MNWAISRLIYIFVSNILDPNLELGRISVNRYELMLEYIKEFILLRFFPVALGMMKFD